MVKEIDIKVLYNPKTFEKALKIIFSKSKKPKEEFWSYKIRRYDEYFEKDCGLFDRNNELMDLVFPSLVMVFMRIVLLSERLKYASYIEAIKLGLQPQNMRCIDVVLNSTTERMASLPLVVNTLHRVPDT